MRPEAIQIIKDEHLAIAAVLYWFGTLDYAHVLEANVSRLCLGSLGAFVSWWLVFDFA